MSKLQRQIDPIKMEQAKERTIHSVMSRIESSQTSFSIKYILRPAFVPALILIFALIILFNGPTEITPPDDNTTVISAFNSEKLAEISYISSSFIGSSITVINPALQFLADIDETEFEAENDTFNVYFDTLRVFLNDDFASLITVTELTDSTYDYLITFDVNGHPYEYYLTEEDGNITGELIINAQTFIVTGTIEEEKEDGVVVEKTITINAENGSDYVRIEYQTESEDEVETEYTIQSRINNVEKNQTINISLEDDESRVEIHDGDNQYTLKKELENGVIEYKLEYQINGVEGEAKIIESVGTNGETTYSYQIKEGDIEKEIEKGKPQYNFDDDHPGNNNDDDEDDDTPGNSGDAPGNQHNTDSFDFEIIGV
ncbi:hypothetical protein [Candidatus Xianfuyuplasma coldseepsis]|uniref:Uncharacterized protein n=1 Tax=Candidatus Xianfuyuplasma coldseepsis TaxID=2782163 RepID=A0A7L7KRA6_9MOLU|nr:hypothetical protein [Xianfuyuplasma coldseepsis]QMS84812.1 hypothetical protein G4Z02_03270 [Xianfuyuplasma coldseepsis]